MDINAFYLGEDEKPLDRIPADGGMTAIFRRIACIGDSLSSGEFQIRDGQGGNLYPDFYEYSWGQFLGRMIGGATVYNFSEGGMTARAYCEGFADRHGYWAEEKKAQCYLMALGVNDISRTLRGEMTFGSLDDVKEDWRENSDTFVGQYARILARYHEISPFAKFFLVTIPRETDCAPERRELCERHRDILLRLAERFPGTYVVDLRTYGPVIDEAFKRNFFTYGHMNPQGYLLTAREVAAYIDYHIRKNPEDFRGVGLIGTAYEERIPTLYTLE